MRRHPFLVAHGYDPGPTQRPVLGGLITGIVASAAGTVILVLFGSLGAAARILGLPILATIAVGAAAMAIAGALYGWLFGRAANDRCGGFLFGMAYGFLLWTGGAVMVLPLAGGGRAPSGAAAQGMLLGLLAWGTLLGLLFPIVHRRFHLGSEEWLGLAKEELGPSAAAEGQSKRPARPAR